MQPIYSTIFFDFDGTLTSSLELWLQAFHHAFAKWGMKLEDETVVDKCFYRDFADVALEFNLPCAVEFGSLVEKKLSNSFEEVSLFPLVQIRTFVWLWCLLRLKRL
jgi:phosphoglycolate phosphatase-like HAD superfamily hydrolase